MCNRGPHSMGGFWFFCIKTKRLETVLAELAEKNSWLKNPLKIMIKALCWNLSAEWPRPTMGWGSPLTRKARSCLVMEAALHRGWGWVLRREEARRMWEEEGKNEKERGWWRIEWKRKQDALFVGMNINLASQLLCCRLQQGKPTFPLQSWPLPHGRAGGLYDGTGGLKRN